MGMLYIDGFDTQHTVTLPERWGIVSGTWTVDESGGRNGGSCLKSSGSLARISRLLGDARNKPVVGFAFKLDADVGRGNYRKLCQFLGDGVPGLQLGVTERGGLRLSTAASSDPNNTGDVAVCEAPHASISADGWYYVEVKATFSSGLSAGGCAIYLFGDQVASSDAGASGLGFGGWNGADTFEFGVAGSSSANVSYDDLYILDRELGTTNIAPRGNCHVPAYRPNGNRVNTDFTPHGDVSNYACVNEVNTDGDGTYVSSDTDGDRDTYSLGVDFATDDLVIYAYQLALIARKNSTDVVKITPSVNTISGDHDSSRPITLTSSYATYLDIWEQDPDYAVISAGSVALAAFGFVYGM